MIGSDESPGAVRAPATSRLWQLLVALLCVIVIGALMSRFHGTDTALAVACGLLIGSTANTFVVWKRKKESLVWAVISAVALAWILALRFIAQT